jgi:allantoin racemase
MAALKRQFTTKRASNPELDLQPNILVLNPNNLAATTDAIRRATAAFTKQLPVRITCVTSIKGPSGIQTQLDADRSIEPLLELAAEHQAQASAYVVACFSDPGLHALRTIAKVPVVGIGECAMLTAMTLGQRIGVIAIADTSVSRHLRYFAGMGISSRVINERSIGMRVADLASREKTRDGMIATAKRLREDGADVIVMGCAGMADLRADVESEVGLAVVEPTQAAVGFVVGRLFNGSS